MSYIYEVDAKAVFKSRFDQFLAFGIPRADVEALQVAIADMWADAKGGWPFEWSALARKYIEAGNPFLASIAYGYAKFPCLADDTRRKALQNQVAAYLAAAPSFPVEFERRLIKLPYRGATIDLPVHLFSVSGDYSREPVLMFSGGVDTYKMDCHDMCVTLAQRMGVTVLAFDQPGTAENPVPLTIEGDEVVLGLVEAARRTRQRQGRASRDVVRRQFLRHDRAFRRGRRRDQSRRSHRQELRKRDPAEGPLQHGRHHRQRHRLRPSTDPRRIRRRHGDVLPAGVAGSDGQRADAGHQRR